MNREPLIGMNEAFNYIYNMMALPPPKGSREAWRRKGLISFCFSIRHDTIYYYALIHIHSLVQVFVSFAIDLSLLHFLIECASFDMVYFVIYKAS